MDFFSFAADNARAEFDPIVTVQGPQTPLAVTLAHSIQLNCQQYDRGEITREVWSDTQIALWKYAESHDLSADVITLVAPSFTPTCGQR